MSDWFDSILAKSNKKININCTGVFAELISSVVQNSCVI